MFAIRFVSGFALTAVVLCLATQGFAEQNSWVRNGTTGSLIYTMDARGDRIMDFSGVGYMGGIGTLPQIDSVVTPDRVVTVMPSAGDNLASIQAAIDSVEAMTLNEHGFRGVVRLSSGQFDISDSLLIRQSGVILQGNGDQPEHLGGTKLAYTGTEQITMVDVGAQNTMSIDGASTTTITDPVVPAGAKSFTVATTAGWQVGEKVVVHRPATQEWIESIGMDDLGDKPGVVPWGPDEERYQQYYERTITHIDQQRNRVFLDNPLAHSLEQQFGGGTMSRYTMDRINNVGIEGIRGDGQKVVISSTNEDHARTFVQFNSVEDSWVTNVTGEHLVYATVRFAPDSISSTVVDAESINPVSQVSGGRRYTFDMDGQLSIMQDLKSDKGRHSFVNNYFPSRGPNVFLDGVATNDTNDSGPHQRYATGTLFDNITSNHRINSRNRYDSGTGHGWSGANMVFWNTETGTEFAIQNPPGAQNWLIGSIGPVATTTSVPGGTPYPQANISAHGSPQTVRGETSLYRAQLSQKLESPTAVSREYWLGDFDEFNPSGTIDQPPVDSAWQSELLAAFPATPFTGMDQVQTGNRVVPFSFEFDVPAGVATSAVISMAVNGPLESASILVESIANQFSIESLGYIDNFDDTQVVAFELLPGDGTDGLALLHDGELNLAVVGDLEVDWADLKFTFDTTVTGIAGDVNLDGLLTPADVLQFDQHWGASSFGLTLAEKLQQGDFNLDGVTNLHDVYPLSSAITRYGFDEPFANLEVPEPAALLQLLSAIALMGLVSCRRRSRP